MLNWADELLDLCDAVVGGRTCFSAALTSLLKVLLDVWKHRHQYVHVCVHSWLYAGLCPIPEACSTELCTGTRDSEHGW